MIAVGALSSAPLRRRLTALALAKSKSHEDEIRAGLAELQKAGVKLDAPADELVPRLKAEFGKDGGVDLAVIFLLGKIFQPAALAALMEIDQRATDRDSKKEIKRSLFKLSQKGIAAEERTATNKPAAPLFASEPEFEAFMSAVDGGGGRLKSSERELGRLRRLLPFPRPSGLA